MAELTVPVILLIEGEPEVFAPINAALDQIERPCEAFFFEDPGQFGGALPRAARPGRRGAPASALVFLCCAPQGETIHEQLARIKAAPGMRTSPVVVIARSDAPEDVAKSYLLGASGYIREPTGVDEWKQVLQVICQYWFSAVTLPIR